MFIRSIQNIASNANRYFIILACFYLFVSIICSFLFKYSIKYLLLLLALLCIISTFGPLNATNISIKSQIKQIESLELAQSNQNSAYLDDYVVIDGLEGYKNFLHNASLVEEEVEEEKTEEEIEKERELERKVEELKKLKMYDYKQYRESYDDRVSSIDVFDPRGVEVKGYDLLFNIKGYDIVFDLEEGHDRVNDYKFEFSDGYRRFRVHKDGDNVLSLDLLRYTSDVKQDNPRSNIIDVKVPRAYIRIYILNLHRKTNPDEITHIDFYLLVKERIPPESMEFMDSADSADSVRF